MSSLLTTITSNRFNPFAMAECTACMALTAGNCANCFIAIGGVQGYCAMSKKVPAATHCMSTLCTIAAFQKGHKTLPLPVAGGNGAGAVTARVEERKPGLFDVGVANATCPDFEQTNPGKYLGADARGCTWRQKLRCGSLLVGCPGLCIAALVQVG